MARQIRIEHIGGGTDTVAHTRSREEYNFGKQDQFSFFTIRSNLDGITLNEGEDEVYLEDSQNNDEAGGVLYDVRRQGVLTELIVRSFEQYAKEAEPTAGDKTYDNVKDSTIISDAISNSPNLSSGTVNNVDSSISFVFSHASQAYTARAVEEATGGELRYNADKTVDYIDKLGSDKTVTTISPANQNVEGEIDVSRHGGERKITHLRAIGAGEGKYQITAEATASSYSSGDRKRWKTIAAKDITDKDTLQNLADTKIAEFNTEYEEVECVIKGETVNLGDRFHFKYSEQNIDKDLRVVQHTRIIDSSGVKHSVTLSDRQETRSEPDAKRQQDIENYNRAFEGTAVPINLSAGRQPVNSSLNYQLDAYYPDEVVQELRLNIRVIGLPYRAYSKGAAAGGDHSHTVSVDHPSHSHDVGVTHPAHSHTVTHPLHGHSVSVTHPSHDHTVTHPSHKHKVDYGTKTSTNERTASFNEIARHDLSSDTTLSDTELLTLSDSASRDSISNDTFMEVNINTSQSDAKMDVRGEIAGIEFLDSRWNSDTGSGDIIFRMPGPFINQTELAELIIRNSDGGNVTIWNTSYMAYYDPLHDHDVNIGKETSDARLGTNETSTTALGTTETVTSDTELGTNESSTTELGTTQTETSDAALGSTTSESSDASGDHTHSADPGIIESFGGTTHYPKDCDIKINGTSQGTAFGDGTGTFEEVYDATGKFNAGAVNEIEVTSQSLGHLLVFIEGDVYRQINGGG
ncbi:MAG: hypothetical protein ABEK59_11725 [Halobacteria archaeon]